MPGFSLSTEAPSCAELQVQIHGAHAALERSEPAFAYALGLYLHWLNDDQLRAESATLLGAAYRALGFVPFAEILDLHVRYRDLGSVDVLNG